METHVHSNQGGTQSVNQRVRSWEIEAYRSKCGDRNAFDSLCYWNRPFVDFLADFYDLSEKRILDYGCGSGFFAGLFRKHSSHVFGCDISDACLEFARQNTDSTITYFKDDFFSPNLEANSYDFIFCRDFGPLQKIDYTEANTDLLKRILGALRDDGVGYFTLMGNLSGTPGDRFTGFQNHRIGLIWDFFQRAGFVSMINVFGYQAVVISRSRETAIRHWQRMDSTIRYIMQSLRYTVELNRVEYLKCRVWSFLNHRADQDLKMEEFDSVDKFMMKTIARRLIKGLCCPSSVESREIVRPVAGPLYLVSGDQDRSFEAYYERALFVQSATLREIGHHIRSKLMR